MNKNINNIVQELIEIDPGFKEHETEIRQIIAEFLAKKPDTRLDPAFVASLRSRLLGAPTPSPFSPFFSGRYFVLGILAVLLVVPLGFYAANQGIGVGGNSTSAVFAMNQQIQHLEADAYGTLQAETGGRGAGSPENTAPMAAQAVSNSVAPTATAEPAKISANMAYGAGGGTSDARMMVPQGPITVYSYAYKGEPLELPANGDVYSRIKNSVSSGQIASQLKKFNFGLMNMNGFADMRVRSFELAEDKPFGYSIQANFDEGMISINPNYTQWPGLNGKVTEQLPLSAMLKDEEAIAIARKFLDEHAISLENYGDPEIQGSPVALAADSQPQFAPEQITVTYPLKIAGAAVYEDGAYPYGLQVGVSVRDKKVMSVYGLTAQTYTSSEYKLETDSEKILSVVSKGGPHSWVPQESDGVTIAKIEAEVGTPTKVLMHTYNYVNGESQELYVPALSFPVTKAPEGEQYYPKNIIVPLVPEILNQDQGPVMYDTVR